MYEQFYGLTEKPFNVTPDPRFLYLGKHHQEALAHLLYGIREKKGFVVITGEVGTGKTTLLRSLLERLEGSVKTALVFNPSLSLDDFFLLVSDEFELKPEGPSKGQFLLALNAFLLECASRSEVPVLIVDEAQNLSPELMEEIRMLLNLETSSEKLLQIILSGQPELVQKLNLPELRQLKQRISLRYDVHPLTGQETGEYIRERLRTAGARNLDVFTPKALNAVFDYSQGIPRLINVLCDSALLAGYADERETIDIEIIRECILDLEGCDGRSGRTDAQASFKKKQSRWNVQRAGIVLLLVIIAILSLWVLQLKYPQLWRNYSGRGVLNLIIPDESPGADYPAPDATEGGPADSGEKKDVFTSSEKNADITETGATLSEGEKGEMQNAGSGTEADGAPIPGRLTDSPAAGTQISEKEQAGITGSLPLTDADSSGPAADRVITVGANDSLSKISLKYYGLMTSDILEAIKKVNPQIVDINYIEEGWRIVLPDAGRRDISTKLFSVHVASFKTFDDAYRLFTTLVQDGKDAFLVPVSIPGKGGWYRVTIGGFTSQAEAHQYASQLLDSHGSDYAEPISINESAALEIEREGEELVHE